MLRFYFVAIVAVAAGCCTMLLCNKRLALYIICSVHKAAALKVLVVLPLRFLVS